MKDWISEMAALALIAERLGCDIRTAAAHYIDGAEDGEFRVRETVFCPPYGIENRYIPAARWGSAIILRTGDPRWNEDGPIVFLSLIDPPGGGRHVNRFEIEKCFQAAATSPPPVTIRGADKTDIEDRYKQRIADFKDHHHRFPNRDEDRKWAGENGIKQGRLTELRERNIPEAVRKGGRGAGVILIREKPTK
ncbi:MAG TPA: hypothetical protein VGF34_15025 [Stellaceae bacterium]|jgi:hypothetical protein